MFGEENFPLNIKQKTDYSYVLDMHYETEEYILGETDKLLIIGAPQYVEDSKSVFRVIFLEISRIFNHLLAVVTHAIDVGAFSPFL